MVDNLMQRPQAGDVKALPMTPIVQQGATQTNANTGGPISWGSPGAPMTAAPAAPPTGGGMVSRDAVGNLQALAAQDPGAMQRLELNRRLNPVVGQPVSGPAAQELLSRALPSNGGPTPSFIPASPQHAAAGLMQYLTGHAEGAAGAANAAAAAAPAKAPPHTPTPGYNVPYPNAPGGRPDAHGNFPGYHDQYTSMGPGPLGFAGYAGGGAAPAQAPGAAPQGQHFLNDAATTMGRSQFAQAFRGVPAFLVLEAMQHLKPPSVEDQARIAATNNAAKAANDGDPAAKKRLADLMEAIGIGPNWLNFSGTHPRQ